MQKPRRQRSNDRIYLLGILWVAGIILGVIGFSQSAAIHAHPITFWDALFQTIQLVSLNSGAVEDPVPLALELARFMIPILTAAAAINALLGIFRQEVDVFRLRFIRNHVIVCGLSRKGAQLAESLRARGEAVVVIELDEENDRIDSCRQHGAIVLTGDATDAMLLRKVGLSQARGLIAVCDDDGINAEIALRAQELYQGSKERPFTCLAHIVVPALNTLLQEHGATLQSDAFRLELFNVFERGARRMLLEYPAWNEARRADGPAPHILVIGLGWMGENLVRRAAWDWWNSAPHPQKRLKITIIDRKAEAKLASLHYRIPQLASACQLIPLQMDIRSPEFERAAFLFDEQGKLCIDAVYILVDDDALSLSAGMSLLEHMAGRDVLIVMRMAEEGGLARLLNDRKDHLDLYHNLFVFGLLDRICTPDLLTTTRRDLLARAFYEESAFRRRQAGAIAYPEPALPPWEWLAEALRQPSYRQADQVQALLAEIGADIIPLNDWEAPALQFSPGEVERMARRYHEARQAKKMKEGQLYAPGMGDPQARFSADLVAWEQLPESSKENDRQYVRDIPAFLGRAGYQVKKMVK
jgi:hypothetical protein